MKCLVNVSIYTHTISIYVCLDNVLEFFVIRPFKGTMSAPLYR